MHRLKAALLAVAVLGGCSSDDSSRDTTPSGAGARPSVYVVNYPLQYFAQRVGGEHVDVVFPAPPDVDPAFWSPGADDIARYQNADIILLNGAGYAKWTGVASLPQSRVVNTSASFASDYIVVADAATHSHGPTGDHAHAGTAFTTWLDFSLAGAHARAITDAFVARWPGHEQQFESAYRALESDLTALDEEFRAIVDAYDRPLVASHPVYQYFARRYGATIESVLWEPEEPPGERHWVALAELLTSHPARWMIWEGEPIPESVARLETLGVGSVVLDPCGNTPDDGDFLGVMERNASQLRRALK